MANATCYGGPDAAVAECYECDGAGNMNKNVSVLVDSQATEIYPPTCSKPHRLFKSSLLSTFFLLCFVSYYFYFVRFFHLGSFALFLLRCSF